MGSLFGGPKRDKTIEELQRQQSSLLAQKEQKANADSEARRRAVLAAQTGFQRGLLSTLSGSGITRKLGGG